MNELPPQDQGPAAVPPGTPPPAGPGPPYFAEPYPVRYDVEYPDRELNRLTTFFRIFTAIPILILLSSVQTASYGAGFAGILFCPALLMILFRQKYPRWWFDWNRELLGFSSRVGIYMYLMDDRYPSTDEQQSLRLEIDYPEVERDLNRWLPLVKWFLAIPHFIVLVFLGIAACFVVLFAWFAILFTGRYPRGVFEFVVGVNRWYLRVVGYAFLLVTDRYPPFSLQP